MSIKINGKDMSKDEALTILEDKDTKITTFSTQIENNNLDKTLPMSSEGFAIKKELISSMCDSMDSYGAADIKLKLEGSPLIKGRTLYIIMANPDSDILTVLKKHSET